MGTWNIKISGHGCHHNDRFDDANNMARLFVGSLRAAGHTDVTATFTLTPSGEPEDISDGIAYGELNEDGTDKVHGDMKIGRTEEPK